MHCIKVDIPQEICEIDDELKAIYSAAKERSPALAPGHLIMTGR